MNKTFTVSQLNRFVKTWLESEVGAVEVKGEISNLARPKSGHLYFSLKDENAQIRCVFFRNYHNKDSIDIKDGLEVIINGTLSLYEARGDYQLIAHNIRTAGDGALLQQFLLLKNKLEQEGLFNNALKCPLPSFPCTIGVITSATGAALQDIITTIKRRFPLTIIYLYPSEVQGAAARQSLISALSLACQQKKVDVLILARGGGSIEDLQAFNDETLARLIRKSPVPVVTGIGHETDFTIADFVADFRAPTPTGAAEAVTPNVNELNQHLNKDLFRLQQAINHVLRNISWQLEQLQGKLKSPQEHLQQFWQRLDRAYMDMITYIETRCQKEQHKFTLLLNNLHNANPNRQLEQSQKNIENLWRKLIYFMHHILQSSHLRLKHTASTLHAVSPLATLDRGYSITSINNRVIYDSSDVKLHDIIEIRLKHGKLLCEVLKQLEAIDE